MTATNACGRNANSDSRKRVECRNPKAASETRRAKRVAPAGPPRPPEAAEAPDGPETGSGADDPPAAGSGPEPASTGAAKTFLTKLGESGPSKPGKTELCGAGQPARGVWGDTGRPPKVDGTGAGGAAAGGSIDAGDCGTDDTGTPDTGA